MVILILSSETDGTAPSVLLESFTAAVPAGGVFHLLLPQPAMVATMASINTQTVSTLIVLFIILSLLKLI